MATDNAWVRDLILVLADSKRLLGTRYAEWILGAPELETGIACAAMAQDEWGHARLLYALLKDFGEDVDRLEHGRQPAEYCNIEILDRAPESWAELVVVNALVDSALTVQLEALTDSSYAPLRQRVGKLIEEERFHHAHGLAWARRLASTAEGHTQLFEAVKAAAAIILPWFGQDSQYTRAAVEAGLVSASPEEVRENWMSMVLPLFAGLDVGEAWSIGANAASYDERTRRNTGTAPDAATIARVRGDKNRAFLMD
jgi:phenylacetate-CoA oxygenase PaaI subunit